MCSHHSLPSVARNFRRICGFTLIELLVVIAIMAVLLAMMLPALQMAREVARRSHCQRNLLQMGLALQNYSQTHELLPPGCVNKTGPLVEGVAGYHVGWLLQIMPQLDQPAVFKAFDFQVGLLGPKNLEVGKVTVSVLHCPSDPGRRRGTSYAANHSSTDVLIDTSNDGVFYLNSGLRYQDLPDGSSNTIFMGEKLIGDDLQWIAGTRTSLRNGGMAINLERVRRPPALDRSNGLGGSVPAGGGASGLASPPQSLPGAPPSPQISQGGVPGNEPLKPAILPGQPKVGGFSSYHVGGAYFGLGDGSVRFLSESIDLQVYQRLLNRQDGTFSADF